MINDSKNKHKGTDIKMEINYKELIKRSHSFRKDEYIDYFFKNIVGTDEKPIYCKENDSTKDYFDIAIVKNYKEKKSKVGNSYIGKYWRTCIFYCIDKEDAYEYLNTSNKKGYSIDDGIISWDTTIDFKKEMINERSAKSVNFNVLKYYTKARSSWFVNSYVYFVLIICDKTSPISSKDFYIHYWNRKYAFKSGSKSSLFGKSKKIVFVEDVLKELELIKDKNKDSIDCVRTFFGDLNFFPENEEAFTDIKKDIDSGIPYIICQGAARTGKTILAFRLLREYPDFKLLLMNYNFYVSLKDAFGVIGQPFPSDRIFHHDLKHKGNGCWISGSEKKYLNMNISRLIVDEAQRLGTMDEARTFHGRYLSRLDSIKTIVDCDDHIQTIFFGDDSQMLNPKYDKGIHTIKEAIGENDYREYYFSSPLGIPQELLRNIQFLLNFENSEPYALNNFSISVEKNSIDFINHYLNDGQTKKHLIVPIIGDIKMDDIEIGGINFKNLKSTNSSKYLFNSEIQNQYFLTAYSVISREIESVYIYIPKYIYLDDKGIIQSFNGQSNSFLMKHLYTIMTRATMSLVICCEDEKLADYFNERIMAMKSVIKSEETDETFTFDYDVFIAYFGTNRPDGTYEEAKAVCDLLKEKGLKVFLNNYSFISEDNNLMFTETWHALSRSETMVFVFNENVDKDNRGLIIRELPDGSVSQIYRELSEFQNMIDNGFRKAKYDAKFFYSGQTLTKFNVYPFLNKYYPPLTHGNSDCCFLNNEELLNWLKIRFPFRIEDDD